MPVTASASGAMPWRAIVHYLSTVVILSAYGAAVCPFLETLTPGQLSSPIAVAVLLQYALRHPLRRRLVDGVRPEKRIRNAFLTEYGLYLASGTAMMVFNTVVYGFPFESGAKLVVGMASLGFFAAVDLALQQERALISEVQASGRHLELDARYFPVSAKLGLFAAVTVVLVVLVVFLVISKDLLWLAKVGESVTMQEAQRAILAEVLFVAAVTLAHVFNAIRSYARNLRCFFDNENGVLDRAMQGDLDGWVPVSSNDEFGIMARHTNAMIQGLRERNEALQRTQDVTILSLASLAETRDNETGAHILRTQRYVRALARQLENHPRFTHVLDAEAIDLMYKSAPLHDVGKVGIPDAILLKPGKLTDEEWQVMRTHPQLGADALAVAEAELGGNSFLRYAGEISLTHHEKWDGSGYPRGLSGEAIPVSGRLMAVADVYDALISERVYKAAWPHEKAAAHIVESAGTHFDPDVVAAFEAVETEFKEIAQAFSDAAYAEAAERVEEAPQAGKLMPAE